MPRPKKTAEKATARKATPKKTTASARDALAKKMATKMTSSKKEQDAIIKMLKSPTAPKRPPNNPDVPQTFIDMLNHDLNAIKETLESFAAHLRSLDRCPKAVGFWACGFSY